MKIQTWQQLGDMLKQARIDKKLTQYQVAKALGYTSSQFISNIERGTCAPPMKKLGKLVKLYSLDSRVLTEFLLSCYKKELRQYLPNQSSK